MASSKPVVAIDWGAGRLSRFRCGILLPAKDPATLVRDLERTIVQLAADGDRCGRVGLTGRAKVMAEHAWPVKIEQLVKIYREVLDLPAETESREERLGAVQTCADRNSRLHERCSGVEASLGRQCVELRCTVRVDPWPMVAPARIEEIGLL